MSPDSPTTELTTGTVRGLRESGVRQYRGIPYAASTGGENRFRPPQPVEPWPGVRDAVEWGSMSPQSTHSPSSLVSKDRTLYYDTFGEPYEQALAEDCLTVHVWEPDSIAAAPRPVMVWIHGGGFDHGTAAASRTDGSAFAREHDVVMVSSSHRLGALGYTFLGDIDPEYADTANVGMLDIVACLEWVRDNAAAFGGDPANVTLFCESGGGLKVTTLMGMPSAQGLFHKVILQSAVPWPTVLIDRAEATRYANLLLEELEMDAGQPLAPQFALKNTIEIVEAQWRAFAQGATEGGQPNGFGFSPHLDGTVITETPLDALTEGGGADIPMITGFTEHEWGAILSTDPTFVGLDEETMLDRVQGMVGAAALTLVAVYRSEYPELTPEQLMVRIVSHRWFVMSTAEVTDRRVRNGSAPFREYLFAWKSPKRPELGAFHGSEGSFIFDSTEAVPLTHSDPEAPALAHEVNAAWARFARTGDPNGDGFPLWPANLHDEHAMMVFDHPVRLENDPLERIRAAWIAAIDHASAHA
jgi:para-nitrobenzyl esterase